MQKKRARNGGIEMSKETIWERIASELLREKRVSSLNDFIEIPKRRHFHKIIQLLEKQGVIRLIYPKVTEILHIGLGKDHKAKSTVLTVIVKHTRKRYLKMCHGYPTPERREFFQCLHRVFGIPPSDQRSFDRMLCRIINRVTENNTNCRKFKNKQVPQSPCILES